MKDKAVASTYNKCLERAWKHREYNAAKSDARTYVHINWDALEMYTGCANESYVLSWWHTELVTGKMPENKLQLTNSADWRVCLIKYISTKIGFFHSLAGILRNWNY